MSVAPSAGVSQRIAVAIPHYWSDRSSTLGARSNTAEQRAMMLSRVITTLHETFSGPRQVSPGFDAAYGPERRLDVLVVTAADGAHLLDHLAPIRPLFTHIERTMENPMALPLECRTVLADRIGEFDEYACLEDDIVVADPFFFDKLNWFRERADADAVLMPRRFERRSGLKAYIDPLLSADETASFQDLAHADEIRDQWSTVGEVVFRQVDNPHSSCWFVSADQMARWARHPRFATFTTEFIAPIESAMCPAVGGPFRLYKAVLPRPDFLEVEHATQAYLEQWALPEGKPAAVVSGDRNLARQLADARQQAADAAQRAADAEAAYDALVHSPTLRLTAPFRNALRRVVPRRSH